MEQLRLGLKSWLKSILKPIMVQEILNDIKKIFIRVWNFRFCITLLVLFCMILQLHIAVGRINIRIGNNNEILVKIGRWKILSFPILYSQPPGPETARQLQTISELETEIETVRKLLDERDLTIKLLVMRMNKEAQDNAWEAEEGR